MEQKCTVRLQLKARYLPFVVGLLLLLQLLVPYRGWMILLVGMGGAWLLSHRWARSLARGLELTREMRYGWAQVGDRLQERFTLANRGWAPATWVAILDQSDLPGYNTSAVKGVGERAVIHWFEEGVCNRRGLYTLGPTSLQTGDPFGFYAVTLEYPTSVTMMVMPPVVHLPSLDVAPAGRAGEGRHRTRALEQDLSVASVREYAPGDSLRLIHWPTTARRDEPFVRTFDSTPSSDWWIFLDMDRRVQAGEGQTSTEEHGVILAASLAERGLQSGKAVGLAAQGADLAWLPPRLGADQRWQILRALALVEPGQRSLTTLLARARPSVKGRSGLVIITPNLGGAWLEAMAFLMRRGVVPTVLLLDAAAFGGEGDAGHVVATLEAMDVSYYLITPDLLDRPEIRPGRIGHWRQTDRGRWEPKFNPRELAWRSLT
ncbi:MAG: DUF58 domain-containing protein [Anaerolineae bacterium]